jgi:hypothetical protein
MCLRSSPYQPPLKIAPTPPVLQPFSFPSEPIIDLNDLMSMSAVTCIPPESVAGPSSQQRIHHVQSDCGHYGSPRLNRSHSLLRNFSLRSRNTPIRPGNARWDSAPASTASGSSLLAVWKKWRGKSVTNLSTFDDAAQPHPMQGPARKRSLFLPVGRLIAPFQFPSSPPSDDSPCVVIIVSFFYSV